MVALKGALSELHEVSAQLNQESDTVNELIASVEKSINEAAPGVEFWGPTFEQSTETEHDEKAEETFEAFWASELGYGRCGDAWRILMREVRYRMEVVDYGQEDPKYLWIGAARPLSDAPRSVRVAAAPELEQLVEGLARNVKARLEGLRKAKAKVK